jgi:hypothetical protein
MRFVQMFFSFWTGLEGRTILLMEGAGFRERLEDEPEKPR